MTEYTTRRSVLRAVGGVAATTGIAGCSGALGGEVTLGAIGFGGGQYSSLQPPITQTLKMAEKEINDAGGIQGQDVEIKIRSSSSRPQELRTVMQTFAEQDDVKAVVGGVSGELVPIVDYLKDFEIPIISPYAGARYFDQHGGDKGTPDDTSDDGWIWRTEGSDTVYGAASALQCLDNDLTRVAVMNDPSAGSRSWRDSFTSAIKKGGGSVAGTVEFETGKSSYNSEISELFENDFDAWLLVGPRTDKTTIVRQWANSDHGGQLLLDNNLGEKLRKGIGEPGKGGWICASAQGGGPNRKRVTQKYNEFTDVEANTFITKMYDAAMSASLALEAADEVSAVGCEKNIGPIGRQGGTKVASFAKGKDALDGGSANLQGASSKLNYTKYGNVIPPIGVYRVTPDEFVQFKTIDTSDLKEIADI